jgi:hypothetical protein
MQMRRTQNVGSGFISSFCVLATSFSANLYEWCESVYDSAVGAIVGALMIGAGATGIPSMTAPPQPHPQPLDGIITPRDAQGLHVSQGLHVLHRRARHSPQLPTPHSQPVALAVKSATAARMRSLFMPVISVKDLTTRRQPRGASNSTAHFVMCKCNAVDFCNVRSLGNPRVRGMRSAPAATNLVPSFSARSGNPAPRGRRKPIETADD